MDFKGFVPTPLQIAAGVDYLFAIAWADGISLLVREYEKAILAEKQWHVSPRLVANGVPDRVVTDPGMLYLLAPADRAVFHQLRREARQLAGLRYTDPEVCPRLDALDLVLHARAELFDAMAPVSGFDAERSRSLTDDQAKRFATALCGLLTPWIGLAEEFEVQPSLAWIFDR